MSNPVVQTWEVPARMDRSNLVWLDLCSGLGGASQPALDRGWKVIRVDIDPQFKPDIVADTFDQFMRILVTAQIPEKKPRHLPPKRKPRKINHPRSK